MLEMLKKLEDLSVNVEVNKENVFKVEAHIPHKKEEKLTVLKLVNSDGTTVNGLNSMKDSTKCKDIDKNS